MMPLILAASNGPSDRPTLLPYEQLLALVVAPHLQIGLHRSLESVIRLG